VVQEYKEYSEKITKPMSEIIAERFFPYSDPLASPRWIYAYNKFPYEFEKDILHVVAWIQPGQTVKEKHIIEDLQLHGIEDMVIFRNITNLMSVPGLDHIQVFIKDSDKHKIDIQVQ
jgi:hypothetical protein